MKSATAMLDPSLKYDAVTKAKAMMRVGQNQRPFLDYLLLNIQRSGYRNVVIVVGENDTSIRGYYEAKAHADEFSSLQISYVPQMIPAAREKPLGTADALLQALNVTSDWKGGRFTVCNSDNLYSENALRLLLEGTHLNALIDYDRSALGVDNERISQWSVIVRDREGYLQDIVEKPSPEEISHAADRNGRVGVSMNIWRFSYDAILPFLETVPLHPLRGEKELPTAVRTMVSVHPRSVHAIPLSEQVVDLTSQNDVTTVMEYLRNQYSQF
jgi:dTDP-glucose pyrophosphorylase